MNSIHRCCRPLFCRLTLQEGKKISNCIHTSSCFENSGRFKQIRSQPDSFFQRKSNVEESSRNFLFSRDYLDRSVDKFLSSGRRNSYSFLKSTRRALKEDEEGFRENVTRDWNHISDTVQDLGIPEFADVIGGQMFAGNNLRQTTTCCLTLRLADNIDLLSDEELKQCIDDVTRWPSDVTNSDVLQAVYCSIDKVTSGRCEAWSTSDSINFALLWSRGPFRRKEKLFQSAVLNNVIGNIAQLSTDEIMRFFLLCSYEAKTASELTLSEKDKQTLEDHVIGEFNALSESEVALAYTALHIILRHKPLDLKKKMEDSYGFRL